MSYWDEDIDLTKRPLSDRNILVLSKLGVGLYRNYQTGECSVSQRYWDNCGSLMQEALGRLVLGRPTEEEKLEKAASALEDEASHE